MVAAAFFAVLTFIGVSLVLCLVGCLITWAIEDRNAALQLFDYWIFNFNGLLVGGSGWGMAALIYRESRPVFNRLINLLDMDVDTQAALATEFEKTRDPKRILGYGLIIGSLGVGTLLLSGYPLSGFPKWYLACCSASLHIVGAFILVHLYYTVCFFRQLDLVHSHIRTRDNFAPYHMERFNTYFIVTATMGIVAIYFAFRGTLTAGFTFPIDYLEKVLVFPLIIYLPIGLMYSFYPRYVLKRVHDRSNIDQVDRLEKIRKELNGETRLELQEKLHLHQAIADLREKLVHETRQLPILNIKDYPSLLLAILMFVQYILREDSVVSDFLDRFTR